ncbi:MAG: hypothetical protein ACRYF4_04545 [Janthinobacterium lividum]
MHDAEVALEKRQLDAALQAFDAAEQNGAAPDRCAAGRWTAWMLKGDFAAAWLESDAIRARGGHDPHRFWQRESVDGKRLIVRCLHGLGDAVQMLRYLPLLRARCSSVTLEVPPRLLPLTPLFAGVDEVVTWGEDAPEEPPSWDVQVEVMELPYLFRTAVEDLPVAEHYLSVPAAGLFVMAGPLPRVGVVWSASEWDVTRRLPVECLQQVLAVPGIEFWNLQGGPQHDPAGLPGIWNRMRDAAAFGDGLLPLAAVIANMDLVLTVDTLAAHMAGAMERPAWVMLQHRADWRWMHARGDSPWYPTLRLFRQPRQDDWSALTTQMCEALNQWKNQQQ